ncbi:MAG: sigma-70 family RNA polymerase sigma factor [Acidobacteria bacterium]|nr:sigma-70 family RNA polymerase sigma factor [Acidobacteriota bacterium]
MIQAPPQTKKHRVLTQAALDGLLSVLSADRVEAAEKYEHLRQALITYFTFQGAADPSTYADEAFNRVAGRLAEGLEIVNGNPAHYFFGVARNIWREAQARPQHIVLLDEVEPRVEQRAPDPHELLLQTARQDDETQRLGCLEGCLQKLAAQERVLLEAYFADAGRTKIEQRRVLAERLGLAPKTLRNKVSLLRAQVADCIIRCQQEAGSTKRQRAR